MLPMIVTSTLAKGAVLLSRRKVIVKRLDAIQNFGAMEVLCTDKTGTLTQDKIALERHTDVFGHDSEDVLAFAYLNSHFQTGLINLLDRAVLEHVELQSSLRLSQDYHKVDEIPFDFERRRMSVVVSEREDHHELICKGAVEEMLAVCSTVRENGQDMPLDDARLARVRQTTEELNEQGLRVVAVAMKETAASRTAYSQADECDLTLVGYVAFLDPPKESAAQALQALAAHGVEVKVFTGDNELVTARVCAQVGLDADTILTGPQIERMDDGALSRALHHHRVFARLTPLHKERLVRELRAQGKVVGFLGDGINDAPALRAADIGISVDSAVDIAKEAADIILLEKNLMVLEEGFQLWQRVFGAGGVGLPAVPADAAIAAAGAEPAVRHLADCHSVRQRGRGTGTQAAEVEPGRHRPLHGVLRADQLDLRPDLLRLDVVRVRCTHACRPGPVPVRLVRGRPADPDPDRAHDPYAEGAVPAEHRRASAAADDRPDHGHRRGPADEPAGRLLQAAGPAGRLLAVPGGDPVRLCGADHRAEEVLHPLTVAFVLGTAIGLERQLRQRTAGLRTNTLGR
ncbi:hypothetical protein G6F65_014138 [Rhizopus arrhizus]|nr:hypothetical protein G6F65_014138 [Rhizopus arrhizus]